MFYDNLTRSYCSVAALTNTFSNYIWIIELSIYDYILYFRLIYVVVLQGSWIPMHLPAWGWNIHVNGLSQPERDIFKTEVQILKVDERIGGELLLSYPLRSAEKEEDREIFECMSDSQPPMSIVTQYLNVLNEHLQYRIITNSMGMRTENNWTRKEYLWTLQK